MLSILGVPTNSLSLLLEELVGTVNRSVCTDDTIVSVEFGLLKEVNLDDLEVGLPIVFQLASSNISQYEGNSSYTFTTSVTYKTKIDSYTYEYTLSGDASKSVQFSLTV